MRRLYALRPGPLLPLRRLWLMGRYVPLGKNGTVSERTERLSVASALYRLDARLRQRNAVNLRVSDSAKVRLTELAYRSDGPVRSPGEVVRHRVQDPAERLVETGKAKRGDTLAAERHPLGNRIRVGVLRRD